MTFPGFFISLEGVDGSGKSTQAPALAAWLAQNTGAEVVLTREPGGTELGLQLRQVIQHGLEMGPRAEALLYAADRAHHVDTLVRPALERGAIVLTDRYLDSSVAYQAAGRQLPPDQIEQISLWATNGLLPNVSILLDIDPLAAKERQVGELDRIEKAGVEFQQRVREGYLNLVSSAPDRWLVVPAIGNQGQVFEAITAALTPQIAKWRQNAQGDQ